MCDDTPVSDAERAELGQVLLDAENAAHDLLRMVSYGDLRAHRDDLIRASGLLVATWRSVVGHDGRRERSRLGGSPTITGKVR